jgi:hypothetical protein
VTQLTGLPVLGSISRIRTKEDLAHAQHKRKLLWAAAGFSVIIAMLLIHFLYMDLWVLTANLLRLAHKYN